MDRKHDVGSTEDDSSVTKKPRRELDVTVNVGDKQFQHNSLQLRGWSDFFDAALTSGMKESETKTITFPDRNPEDWQLLVDVLDPFKKDAVVTAENLGILLPWFHELCIGPGIEECDQILAAGMEEIKERRTTNRPMGPSSTVLLLSVICLQNGEELDSLLQTVEWTIQYDLIKCRNITLNLLSLVLRHFKYHTKLLKSFKIRNRIAKLFPMTDQSDGNEIRRILLNSLGHCSPISSLLIDESTSKPIFSDSENVKNGTLPLLILSEALSTEERVRSKRILKAIKSCDDSARIHHLKDKLVNDNSIGLEINCLK